MNKLKLIKITIEAVDEETNKTYVQEITAPIRAAKPIELEDGSVRLLLTPPLYVSQSMFRNGRHEYDFSGKAIDYWPTGESLDVIMVGTEPDKFPEITPHWDKK